MQIFIMRHGEAATKARSDAARPLTEKGRSEVQKMSVCLQQRLRIPLDRVLVSPYLRAQQTLAALSDILTVPDNIETLDRLVPAGSAQWSASYLAALSEQGVQSVLVVSHLPLVGDLVAELCPTMAVAPTFFPATIAALSLQQGRGELLWQLSPNQH